MSVKHEIDKFMKECGFKVVRKGKHIIWSDGLNSVVTSISPSDRRALLNAKATVKRLKKETQAC